MRPRRLESRIRYRVSIKQSDVYAASGNTRWDNFLEWPQAIIHPDRAPAVQVPTHVSESITKSERLQIGNEITVSICQRLTECRRRPERGWHARCNQSSGLIQPHVTMKNFPQAAVMVGVVLMFAVPMRGLPVSSEFLVATLGVAARETVRDPYRGFIGLSDHGVTAVPIAQRLASTLPTIGAFGGGGGFSGFSSGFSFVPSSAPAVIAPPPSGGVYFSLSNARPQSNVVIGAVQVPEGGVTAMLFSLSLAAVFFFHRRRTQKR